MSDYRVENKQISIDDIIRVSNFIEEYSQEWKRRANAENEYLSGIDTAREYSDLTSKIVYEIDFEDGRSVEGEKYEWLIENLLDIDNVKNVNIRYSMSFFDYKTTDEQYKYKKMYISVGINRKTSEEFEQEAIKFSIDSNLDEPSKVILTQLNNIVSNYGKYAVLNANDISKFAKYIEGIHQEWMSKKEQEDMAMVHTEIKDKPKYKDFSIYTKYTIEYYDGRQKTEEDKTWFKNELSNSKNIKDAEIVFKVSFWDYKDADGELKSIRASIDFYAQYSSYLSSRASYSISSDRMESEADSLYGRIDALFRDNKTRLDSTIKNRNLRIQAFSIAVGLILSYIIFVILKITLGSSNEVFASLLKNKNVIVFGQWLLAIIVGNIGASWFINTIYKPLLPDRKYVGYNGGEQVYRDDLELYTKDSEVQIGILYDAAKRRQLINKLFKISLIVIAIQLVISILLFLILK